MTLEAWLVAAACLVVGGAIGYAVRAWTGADTVIAANTKDELAAVKATDATADELRAKAAADIAAVPTLTNEQLLAKLAGKAT